MALVDMCHKAKNLYNAANYVVRQALSNKLENIPEYADLVDVKTKKIKSKKDGGEREYTTGYISEFDLSKRMAQLNQPDYRSLKAQCSQQVIAGLFRNYKAFFSLLKDYSKNPEKYTGRPKPPGYKDKNGLVTVVFTNQNSTLTPDGHLKLSKELVLRNVRTGLSKSEINQVRVVPKADHIEIEILYTRQEVEYTRQAKERNNKTQIAGIDIGVDNLAAVTSDNADSRPLLVNGRPLKSINQYYNKPLAELKEVYSRQKIKTGRKSRHLGFVRVKKIDDYLHKASRRVVDYCINNNCGTVYIGHNKGWKQNVDMGSRNNQNFVSIPFDRFIHMLQYKLEEVGIQAEVVDEAYTSKCSFLDDETVGKHERYLGKRVKRGLFRSSNGRALNADVNGSLNIMKVGSRSDITVGNPFNPVKIDDINEIRDAFHFAWTPVDRGRVSRP